MITITEQPADLVFSKNPIRYKATTNTSLSTPGLFIRCRIFYNAALRITFPLSPDSTGAIAIDIRRVIDSLLLFTVPSQTLAVEDLVNQYATCYIELHEITTADPTDADYKTSSTSTVIKGGLAYEIWDRNNYFSSYTNAQKCFLTWYPTGRSMAPWQYHWLTYLHQANTSLVASVEASINYTDGTSANVSLFAFPGGIATTNKIYRFPVGAEQTALDAAYPAKKIFNYTIRVLDGATVLAVYLFKLDYTYDYERVLLHYFGSLGGFDSLRLKGITEPEDSRDAEFAEHYTDGFNTSGQVYTRNTMAKLSIGETYKSNIGWCDELNTQDLRREIFYSPAPQHRLVNDRWWPVQILNKSVQRGALSAQLREMDIDWAYAFTNENYSPSFVNIPAITCALSISAVIAVVTAPDPTNVGYSLSWVNVGGTPASVDLYVSTDGGVTFADVPGAVQVDDTHYTYSLGNPTAEAHIIRLIPNCSPSNPGSTSQTTFTPIGCALSISGITIEAGTAGDYYMYHAEWTNVGGTPDSVAIEVSTDGGDTWEAAVDAVQTDDTNYTYSLGLYADATHMIRLTPMCSPTSPGTPLTEEHEVDPEACTSFVPEGVTEYEDYDGGFEHFIFNMPDAIAGAYHRVGVEITFPDTSVEEYLAFYGVDGSSPPADDLYHFSVPVGPGADTGLYKFRFRICCTPFGFTDLSWGPYTTGFLEITLT